MRKNYKTFGSTVSMLNYHFVFCARYRRNVFLIGGVEDLFKKTVRQICKQNEIEILDISCQLEYCYLLVNCPGKLSPANIMHLIKTETAKVLREEIPELSNVTQIWTRGYFVSSEEKIPHKMISKFIESQKLRG